MDPYKKIKADAIRLTEGYMCDGWCEIDAITLTMDFLVGQARRMGQPPEAQMWWAQWLSLQLCEEYSLAPWELPEYTADPPQDPWPF